MSWKNFLLLGLVLLVFVLGCSSHPETVSDAEKVHREMRYNEAKQLVEKVARFSDQKEWYELESAFSTKTLYNNGTPELLTPTQIVDRWKPVLSYFNKTKHEIFNFQYRETTGHLYGSADFIENYEKRSDVILHGHNEYEFIRESNGELKIMRLTVIPGGSIGNEKLIDRATKVSVLTPANYTIEAVNFFSQGDRLVGWLFKPKNPKSRDVVILSGVISSVKEQIAFPYAQNIVAMGFPVLVFDYAGHGESEGEIRNQESPEQKVQNLLSAVNFIKDRAEYEHSKVNFVSFGDSAGYIVKESLSDLRISRLVMISPWLNNLGLLRKELDRHGDVATLVRTGEAARSKYLSKKGIDYIPVFSMTNKSAVLYTPERELFDYFINPDRGNIPQWQNQFAVMSWRPMIDFNTLDIASLVKTPILIIQPTDPKLPEATGEFSKLVRIKPEIRFIAAKSDDFYDKPSVVTKVVNMTMDFLNKEIKLAPIRQAEEEPVTK